MYIQAIELEDFSYLRDQTSVFDAQSYVGYSIAPDGYPADKTLLYNPQGLWCNSLGDLYYAETAACSIRMINKTTQTVKTIGGYTYCFEDSLVPSNNIPATSWSFPATASQITGDSAGNLYVSVTISHIVFKISGSTNKLNRYAGSGNSASSAVDIDPLTADLLSPSGVAATPSGTLYIVDLDPQTNVGRITFVPHSDLTLKRLIILPTSTNYITSIYFEPDYVYYTSDDGGIYRVDTTITPFVIDTVVSPTNSLFRSLYSYSLTYMYLIDVSNTPIVKLSSSFGTPVDQIGGGSQYEGIARNIQLEDPYGLTGDGSGTIYISQDNFISTYNFNTGLVNVSVGIPSMARFERQDNIPGSLAIIGSPDGLTGDTLGNIYFHDGFFRKVSAVSPHTMTVVTDFYISAILDMKYDRNRHGLVFLTNDGQIRNISISTGTVHGLGHSTSPKRLWVDSNSDIFFTTTLNSYLVNKLISNSQSVIIAGSTTATTDGDGGPALSARFIDLDGIWGNSLGDLFVIDSGSIRKIYYNSITSSLYINKITITDFTDPMYFITGDQYGNLYFTNGAFGTVSAAIPTAEFTYDYLPIAGVGYAHPPQPTNGPANSIIMSPGHIWVNSVGNIFVTDPHYNIIREFHVRVPTSLPTSQPTSQPSRQPGRQPTSQPTTQPTATPSSLITASAIIRNYVGREEMENYTPLNQTSFSEVTNIWGDTLGNLYLADHGACSIRKVPVNRGVVSTIVGIRKCDATTPWSYSDLRANTFATKKALPPMWGITGDTNGNIYYSLPLSHAIMIYYPSTLITTMFIGAASPGDAGGPNIGAQTAGPMGLMMNSQSCLFFADSFSHAIRYSCASNNQVITLINSLSGPPSALYQIGNGVYYTLPGTGTYYYNYQTQGTTTIFSYQDMYGVWVDANGNLYAASSSDQLVYYYDGVATVSSIAGGGLITLDFSPVNDPTSVALNSPVGLWGDSLNRLYVADSNSVLMIDLPEGTIQMVIGDAGSTLTYIRSDRAVYTEAIPTFWIDRNRILYFQDQTTTLESIKMVSPINQEISPITSSLGNSVVCIQGDSINRLFVLRSDYTDLWAVDLTTKTAAVLYSNAYTPISSIFYDDFYPHKDRLLIVIENALISSFNLTTGDIVPLAGTTVGSASPMIDDVALDSVFDQIKEVWVDSLSSIYVIDLHYIRKVYIDPSNNGQYRVKLIAGLGSKDITPRTLNVRATMARLNAPASITGDTAGNVYVSDEFSRYIYYLSPSNSDGSYRIDVFAGTGEPLLALDLTQSLAHETAINPGKLVMHQGSNRLYVHDTGLNIIREILPSFRHTSLPSSQPSRQPTSQPSRQPTSMPSFHDFNNLQISEAFGRIAYEENTVLNDTNVRNSGTLWVNSNDELFYVENTICSIRKVDRLSLRVITVVGSRRCASPFDLSFFSTMRVPATSYQLGAISGVTGDTSGNLYFTLPTANVVMQYELNANGVILYAGTGGSFLQNGNRFNAQFYEPRGIFYEKLENNLFIADYGNQAIRKINLITWTVSTITVGIILYPTVIRGNSSHYLYIVDSLSGLWVWEGGSSTNVRNLQSLPIIDIWFDTNHPTPMKYIVSSNIIYRQQHNTSSLEIISGEHPVSKVAYGFYETNVTMMDYSNLIKSIVGDSQDHLYISVVDRIYIIDTKALSIATYIGLTNYGSNQKAVPHARFHSPVDIWGNHLGDIVVLDYSRIGQSLRFIDHSTNILTSQMDTFTINYLPYLTGDKNNHLYGVYDDLVIQYALNTRSFQTYFTVPENPIRVYVDNTYQPPLFYIINDAQSLLYLVNSSNVAKSTLFFGNSAGGTLVDTPKPVNKTSFSSINDMWKDSNNHFYIIDSVRIRVAYPTTPVPLGESFTCCLKSYYIRSIVSLGTIFPKPFRTVPGTMAKLTYPVAITGDSNGNIYIADQGANYIFQLKKDYPSASISAATFSVRCFAGTGKSSLSLITTLPAGSLPWEVPVSPTSLWLSSNNELYYTDGSLSVIRKIMHVSPTPLPTSQPSTQPSTQPTSLPSIDGYATLYMSDVIGKVHYAEDSLRNETLITLPTALWMDTADNLYYVESNICSVRKVNSLSSRVTTVIGSKVCATGSSLTSFTYSRLLNGISARETSFPEISGLTGRSNHTAVLLYLAIEIRHVILEYSSITDQVTVFVGSGNAGVSDGSRFIVSRYDVSFITPRGLWMDSYNNLFIADFDAEMILMVNNQSLMVSTVASIVSPTFAVRTTSNLLYLCSLAAGIYTMALNNPSVVDFFLEITGLSYAWIDNYDNIFFTSTGQKVWISRPSGLTQVFAGGGTISPVPPTELNATSVSFAQLSGIVGDTVSSSFYITTQNQILKLNISTQTISNFIGKWDNFIESNPLQVFLSYPADITGDNKGNIVVLEDMNIRFWNSSIEQLVSIDYPFPEGIESFQIDNNHVLYGFFQGSIYSLNYETTDFIEYLVISTLSPNRIIVDPSPTSLAPGDNDTRPGFFIIHEYNTAISYAFPQTGSWYGFAGFAGYHTPINAPNYTFAARLNAYNVGFTYISDLCIHQEGNQKIIYLLDDISVRMIYPTGSNVLPENGLGYMVRTTAGGGSILPSKQQLTVRGDHLSMISPTCIVVDHEGTIYVSDSNSFIYRIAKDYLADSYATATYSVSLIAGNGKSSSSNPFPMYQEYPLNVGVSPGRMWVSPITNELYFIDTSLSVVKKISFREAPTQITTSTPSQQPTYNPSDFLTNDFLATNLIGKTGLEENIHRSLTAAKKPTYLWIHPSTNDLYYVESLICSIRKITRATGLVTTIIGMKSCEMTVTSEVHASLYALENIPGNAFKFPMIRGLTGNELMNVLYFSLYTGIVMEYNLEQDRMRVLFDALNASTFSCINSCAFSGPTQLWFDGSTSRIYFTDFVDSHLYFYNIVSKSIRQFFEIDSLDGSPTDLIYDKISSKVYLAQYFSSRITAVDSNGGGDFVAYVTYPQTLWHYSGYSNDDHLFIIQSNGAVVDYLFGVTGQLLIGGTGFFLPEYQERSLMNSFLSAPFALRGDSLGNAFISMDKQIARWNISTSKVQTYLGLPSFGDNLPANQAILDSTKAFCSGPDGNIYLLAENYMQVRQYSKVTGLITTLDLPDDFKNRENYALVSCQVDVDNNFYLSTDLHFYNISFRQRTALEMLSRMVFPISSTFLVDQTNRVFPSSGRFLYFVSYDGYFLYCLDYPNMMLIAGNGVMPSRHNYTSNMHTPSKALETGFTLVKGFYQNTIGDFYIIDGNYIRKLHYTSLSNMSTGFIRTIAGGGSSVLTQNINYLATNIQFINLLSITGDLFGNVFVADYSQNRIFELTSSDSSATTFTTETFNVRLFAGNGQIPTLLDPLSGPALEVPMVPYALHASRDGDDVLYALDKQLNIIRQISLPQPSAPPTLHPSSMPSSQPSSHPSYFLPNDLITTNFIGKTGLEENTHRSFAAANYPTYLWIHSVTNDLYYIELLLCSIRKIAQSNNLVRTIIGMKSCESTVTTTLRQTLYTVGNTPGNAFKFPTIRGLAGNELMNVLYFTLDTGVVMEYNLEQDRMRVLFDTLNFSTFSCINSCAFSGPTQLWFDSSSQQIYFSDSMDDHIYIYNIPAKSIRPLYQFPTSNGYPADFFYDSDSANVYLAQSFNTQILMIDDSGTTDTLAFVNQPRTLWLYRVGSEHLYIIQADGSVIDYNFGANGGGQLAIGGNGAYLPEYVERPIVDVYFTGPVALRFDSLGNGFITMDHQIARWNISTGKVQTYLGLPSLGDNLPANQAIFDNPTAFCYGPDGNIYLIAGNSLLARQYSKATGLITTIFLPGDVSSTASEYFACKIDAENHFYLLTDVSLFNISFVDQTATEIVSTVTFNLGTFFLIDQTNRVFPSDRRFLYFVSLDSYFFYQWDYNSFFTIAGTGRLPSIQNYTSNMHTPSKALETGFTLVKGFYQNTIGDFYIVDGNYIRKLHFTSLSDVSTGFIRTIGGGGTTIITQNSDYAATNVQFTNLNSISGDRFGNIFLSDSVQNRIFKFILHQSGTFSTETFTTRLFAGNGQIPTLLDPLSGPVLEVPMVLSSLYVANEEDVLYGLDFKLNIIRKIQVPQPSAAPTAIPTRIPTGTPLMHPPSSQPTGQPSRHPTSRPSFQAITRPSGQPSSLPTRLPSTQPSGQPSRRPSAIPSSQPFSSSMQTIRPSRDPSPFPTRSLTPSIRPTIAVPTVQSSTPTVAGTTASPTVGGTSTESPTESATEVPTEIPSLVPTLSPSNVPSFDPSPHPSQTPTTEGISTQPTSSLGSTFEPTELPSTEPSYIPTLIHSVSPTCSPTMIPSIRTTSAISELPTESFPPSETPTDSPSEIPSPIPSMIPSEIPSELPSFSPSLSFVPSLSLSPSFVPSIEPTHLPTSSVQPSTVPTDVPSEVRSEMPTVLNLPTIVPSIPPTIRTEVPSSSSLTPSIAASSLQSSGPTIIQATPSISPSLTPTISRLPSFSPSAGPFRPFPSPSASPLLSLSPTRLPTTTSRPSTYFPTRVNVTYVRIVHQSAEDVTDHSLTAFQQVNFIFGTMQFNSLVLRDITLPPIRSNNHVRISNYLVFGRRDLKPLQLMNTSSDSYQPIPNTQSLVSQDSSSSRSITLIADVNGDFFPDILIGDPVSSRVCLLYGNQVGGMSPVYSLEDGKGSEIVSTGFSSSGSGGGNNFDYLGWAVTGGNDRISFDFNGDGLQDWAVSALSSGLVYIVYGRRSSLPRRFLLSSLSASEGLVVVGSEETSNLGIAMSAVGDWNGDGYDDLLMTGMALNSNQQGNVLYLLLGGASIALRKRVLIDALWMSMDRKYLVKIVSPPLSFAGLSVSWVGDVNGDGFDDLLIGSVPYRGKYLVQRSYLVLGRNLTGSVASWVNRTISLESSEGVVEVVGGGMMVRGVGDVDGDGYADMLMVSNGNWQGQSGSYLLRSPVRSELSRSPSQRPTVFPTIAPSSLIPSIEPSLSPTEVPSEVPSIAPSGPTEAPSFRPTAPTVAPSFLRTRAPSVRPSAIPSVAPSSTRSPSRRPTLAMAVSFAPTMRRSSAPSTSLSPTRRPSLLPTKTPTYLPGSPTTPPIISSRPSIIPPDDPISPNKPVANVTIIRVGGTTQDPPSIINPSSSPSSSPRIVEKRVYVVDSPTDVMIQRSLPPSSSSSVVGSGGSYRVYVIKPHKQMKTTIQPFLSSNDVLDLSAYTSYGIYSFEDLSFSRSGAGGGGGSGGGTSIITVLLPRGQQIILPYILSLPSTTSAASSSRASTTTRAAASSSSSGSSPSNFPLTASNFIFGIIPSSQDSNGNYGNIAESGSYQYFSSKDFWDGGLIWTLCWIFGLMLLTCCCVKMELDARDKKEKEIEDILAGRQKPQQDGDQQDDVESAASPIIAPAMIQSVSRGLALSAIEEQTTYDVILGHSHHHNAEDDNSDDEDGDDEDAYGDGVGDEDEEESFSFLSETFPSFHEEEYDQVSRRSQKNSLRSLQSFVLPSSSSSADSGPKKKTDRSDSSSSSSSGSSESDDMSKE